MPDQTQIIQDALSSLLSQFDSGAKSSTIGEVWQAYRWQHVEPNLVGKDLADYCWKNMAPFFQTKDVQEVDQILVNRYIAARSSGQLGRPVRSVTIRRELAYLRAALRYSAGPHARLFPRSLLPEFALPKGSPPRQRWLTVEEFQRLADAAEMMRRGSRLSKLERFLWLGVETGGRRQALLELSWAQVDFEIGVVHLNIEGREQTSKVRASVPMSQNLQKVLERAYRERENHLVLGNDNAGLWRSVQIAAIHAGFSEQIVIRGQKPRATGISPHTLRRTAATRMARQGVSFFIIGQVLGISARTAEVHYARWAPVPASQSTEHITGGLVRLPG
ncbi:MAG TPA: site-specific integrase [Ramlibacter sp.]|jgi:integrase